MKISEAKKLHYKLWDWLYHHPSKGKDDWLEWEFNGGEVPAVDSNCFACEIILQREALCKNCPINWNPFNSCIENESSYTKWDKAKSLKTRKKYAKLVRDVKWRRK